MNIKLSKKMNRVIIVVVLTIDVTCWSFQKLSAAHSFFKLQRISRNPSHVFVVDPNADGFTPVEDWRDVRAKLVLQYSQEEDNFRNGSNSTSASTTQLISMTSANHWAYDSKGTIEVGSLIVSHPSQDSACGGLRQQHFHKCILLIINHSEMGTQGIILNRPTREIIHDKHQKEWKCYFGGNTNGIGSEDESIGCLYRLDDSSRIKNGMAFPILKDRKRSDCPEVDEEKRGDIGIMPWEIAQMLIEEKEAVRETFRLYRGYTKWGPGRLEKELKRGDWFTVATDINLLWNIIAQDPNFSTGTDKWVQLMNRIGKGPLISSVPNQKFQDDMLKQYMRLRLLNKQTWGKRRSVSSMYVTQKANERINDLNPGTLVRSSAPILLKEQVFHQSLVLILKNDDNMIIGVVLNRPNSTPIKIAGKNLPVRYGGRFELDDESMPELWLHCNHKTLQEAKIGEPISDGSHGESMFWKCDRKEAENAIEVGFANANDFLVVSGLSVWNKDPSKDREESSSVELDNFSEVDKSCIGTIWKLLKVQEPLNEANAVENLEAANTAWMLAGDAGWMLSGGSKQFDSRSASDMDTKEQQLLQSLAYSALDKWIRMYLLTP